MIKIMIADDHHLIRQGIRALLEKQADFRVVGEAEDGLEAVGLAEICKPNVILLDINMPQLNGIEVVQRIVKMGLPVQIIMLSMYSDESLVRRAFLHGARGYLLKNSLVADLVAAVHAVHNLQVYVSPELQPLLPELQPVVNYDRFLDGAPAPVEDSEKELTPRERQICQLVARGGTNLAIAQDLGISVKTVEKHRSNLMVKLGVHDMAGLIREALRRGFIFLEDKI
jgi:DNA-binding NarL/FixJ family response regulator